MTTQPPEPRPPHVAKEGQKKFCPTCQKESKKSRVYFDGQRTTLMAGYPYWDEEGNYHQNNPNRTTRHFHCSNYHGWEEE